LEAKRLSEIVHSVNIMIAILLVGVCVTIYWIFKYDDWNPNPVVSGDKPECIPEHNDEGIEPMEIRTE